MTKAVGYLLLALSFLAWGAIGILPFLDFSIGMKTAFTTGLLIFGEVAFFFSVVLLGKDFFMKVKDFLAKAGFFRKNRIKKSEQTSSSSVLQPFVNQRLHRK